MLQETHLLHSTDARLRNGYRGEIHSATYSNYARGMAILIKKGIGWTTNYVWRDPEGRFLILSGRLPTTSHVLVVVYRPNIDDPDFYSRLWATITPFTNAPIIWGGDFNTILNNDLDREGAPKNPHPNATHHLNAIISHFDIRDVWRAMHFELREGTSVNTYHNAWPELITGC